MSKQRAGMIVGAGAALTGGLAGADPAAADTVPSPDLPPAQQRLIKDEINAASTPATPTPRTPTPPATTPQPRPANHLQAEESRDTTPPPPPGNQGAYAHDGDLKPRPRPANHLEAEESRETTPPPENQHPQQEPEQDEPTPAETPAGEEDAPDEPTPAETPASDEDAPDEPTASDAPEEPAPRATPVTARKPATPTPGDKPGSAQPTAASTRTPTTPTPTPTPGTTGERAEPSPSPTPSPTPGPAPEPPGNQLPPPTTPVKGTVLNWNIGRGASWKHGAGTDPNQVDDVADTIAQERPDVVSLQETYTNYNAWVNPEESDPDKIVRTIKERTGQTYHVAKAPATVKVELEDGLFRLPQVGDFGNVVLSREPITSSTNEQLPPDGDEGRTTQTVKTTIKGRPVTIVNGHLTYQGGAKDAQQRETFRRAGAQKGPVIVTGDFNDQPRETDPDAQRNGFTRATGARGTNCEGERDDTIDQVYVRGGVTGSQRPTYECGPSDHPYQVVDVTVQP